MIENTILEKEKIKVFCKICQKNTIYSPKVFFGIHVKNEHNITPQEYYDRFEKKEGEGICLVCKGQTKFIKFSQGYRDYCSPTCTQNSKAVRNKIESTSLERYGTKFSSLNDDVRNKMMSTNLERYGSEHYFSSKEYLDNAVPLTEEQIKLKIERSKETCLARYGVDNFFKTEKIIDDNKRKSIEKFKLMIPNGYELVHHAGHNGIHSIKCRLGHEFKGTYHLIYQRKECNVEPCTVCNPLYSMLESGFQNEVMDFVKSNYDGEILANDRKLIEPLEIDIFLPELNLAFECNGIYWHNELHVKIFHHQYKTDLVEKAGMSLIHIYEDDWNHKKEIVKSRITNALKKTNNKIYARDCEIKTVSYLDSELFLNENHIQGSIKSKIRYGLYYKDELISLMTFGTTRIVTGRDREEGVYELARFCNKMNYAIAGGASRLLSHFVKNNKFIKIISYADRSWSKGQLYISLGFDFVRKTRMNYWYIVDDKREHRYKYRKDALVEQGFDPNKSEHEIMLDRGIYRLYDSGSMLFEYTKK